MYVNIYVIHLCMYVLHSDKKQKIQSLFDEFSYSVNT